MSALDEFTNKKYKFSDTLELPLNFVLSFAAPRGSGKSYFIKSLLESPIIDEFTYVFIFCPSIFLNSDYDRYRHNPKFKLIGNVTADKILGLYNKQKECKMKVRKNYLEQLDRIEYCDDRTIDQYQTMEMPRTLVVLDDCMDMDGVQSFHGSIDEFAIKGRHCDIALIVTSQTITGLSSVVRKNSTMFIIFSPSNVKECETYLEEFVLGNLRWSLRSQLIEIFQDDTYNCIVLNNLKKKIDEKLFLGNVYTFMEGKLELIKLEPRLVSKIQQRLKDNLVKEDL